MAEIISCPGCQRKLQVPETVFGQTVQCPSCQATFTAENPAPPPPGVRIPNLEPYRPLPERAETPRRRGGYDDYGGPIRRRDWAPHRGGAVLTVGILAVVIWCLAPILGPIAWVMGSSDLAQIQAGRMDPSGEGLTRAGQVLGIIATILGILFVVLFFFSLLAETGGRGW